MNQLDKLIKPIIEQAVNYGKLAKIEEHNYDEIRAQLDKFNFQLKTILASRPTCGVEQRKFLDEIEKLNKKSKTLSKHSIIENYYNIPVWLLWNKLNDIINLKKVIKGE